MNKKKTLLNISVSMITQTIFLVFAIFAKRFLISEVGNDANGLYQLFLSITSMISVVELGIGVGIIYCLYEPIAKSNKEKIAALYHLFQKIYFLIGCLILIIGLCIMPLVPKMAGEYNTDCNIYLCYFIALFTTFLPYLFTYKLHLINAYKDSYKTSIITGIGQLLQYGLQIIVVILFKSFTAYLAVKTIGIAVEWVITQFSMRKYKDIIGIKSKLDDETKAEVKKNIKAMFAHKIGYTLINTTDSIIISAFISVTVLGYYSNYISLSSAMFNLLVLFFSPVAAIIGSIYVTRDKKETVKYLDFFHTLNFIVGIIFYLGYYAVIDNAINMFYGKNLLLDRQVVQVLVINLFVQYLRQAILTFRDATGSFYYDRWKPILEGTVNIVLDILLVRWMGIIGVFLATIITNVFISDIIEPLVMIKVVLKQRPWRYFIKNTLFIGAFILCIYTFDMIANYSINSNIAAFFARGFTAVGIALCVSVIVFLLDKNFRNLLKDYICYLFKRGIYAKDKEAMKEDAEVEQHDDKNIQTVIQEDTSKEADKDVEEKKIADC